MRCMLLLCHCRWQHMPQDTQPFLAALCTRACCKIPDHCILLCPPSTEHLALICTLFFCACNKLKHMIFCRGLECCNFRLSQIFVFDITRSIFIELRKADLHSQQSLQRLVHFSEVLYLDEYLKIPNIWTTGFVKEELYHKEWFGTQFCRQSLQKNLLKLDIHDVPTQLLPHFNVYRTKITSYGVHQQSRHTCKIYNLTDCTAYAHP